MTLAANHELKPLGETTAYADHDLDLIHELSRRLDLLWRYDQYIANADGHDNLRQFWSDMKDQEQEYMRQLKELLAKEAPNGCF